MLSISSVSLAQSGAVTGQNLTRVTFGEGETRIEKTPGGDWQELDADGQVRFHFIETGRDASSVYLKDLSRNFAIRLDISDRTLSFNDKNGQKAVFAIMTGMSADPVSTTSQATQTQAPFSGGAVTGQNLTRVTFGEGASSIEKTPGGDWQELGTDGQVRFHFIETGRDASSVYLKDLSRDFAIRLDISDRTLSFNDKNGQKAVFAIMTGMSAEPVTTVAVQPQVPVQPPTSSSTPPWQQPQTTGQARTSSSTPPWLQPQAPTQDQSSPSTPPWQQPQAQAQTQAQTQSSSSTPPWLRNKSSDTQGAEVATTPTPEAQDITEVYQGIWVQKDVRPSEQGDGIRVPVTWSVPKEISLERIDANRVVVRYDQEPVAFTEVKKMNDTQFSGAGATLDFRKSGDSYFLTLRNGSGGTSFYEMAKTADGKLSKTRLETAPDTDRRERFSLDGIAKEWNTNLYGFDGTKMDLFNLRAGRKTMLFRQPGSNEIALDDNLGLALPFGLRGERVRSSEMSQREALISRASEYQKSYSVNFGGGSVFASSTTEVELQKGGGVSTQNMQAVGLANIERYALILDKPNIELSDSFRDAIERMVTGNLSPDQLISTFGTHYANAITYGGIAKATKTMTAKEVMKTKSFSEKVQASGQFRGVTASAGGGYSESSKNTSSSMFTNNDFKAIGGTGSPSMESWSVDDNNTVPMRYDLRPISELISPIFFPVKDDVQKSMRYNYARTGLKQAIERHMLKGRLQDGPPLRVYELNIKQLRCTSVGDDNDKIAEMTGQILVKFPGSNTLDSVVLDMRRKRNINCNGKVGAKINDVITFDDPRYLKFSFSSSHLVENDPTALDVDEKVKLQSKQFNIGQLATSSRWRPLTVKSSGGKNAPRLVLDYEVRKIEF